MPNFEYKASTRDGKVITGKIDTTNEESLQRALRDRGLFPIEIKKESVLTKDLNIRFLQKKIVSKDLFIFCKQFSALLCAGVTVLDGLGILRQQTENKLMNKVVDAIYESVQKGNPLSYAAGLFPEVFPPIFIHMIEAGELSGNLEVTLDRLSTHFEKEGKTTNKIKSAMTYPIVVMCVAIAAVVVVVMLIIPKFESVFHDVGIEMPFFTQMLLNLSAFIKSFWYLILAVIAAAVIGFRFYAKTPGGQLSLSRIALKFPYIGKLNLKVASSRFSRTLSTMLASGLSLFVALDISGKVVGNKSIEKGLSDVSDQVSQGSTLAEPLERLGIFPPMVVHMVKVGESTGEVEQLLNNAASYFDDEVDTAVAQLTSVMEPAIVLVLGGVVLMIVLAIFTPIISMYGGIEVL